MKNIMKNYDFEWCHTTTNGNSDYQWSFVKVDVMIKNQVGDICSITEVVQ